MEMHSEIIKKIIGNYSDDIKVTPCSACSAENEEMEIVIRLEGDKVEIIPANLPFAHLLFDLVVTQHKLLDKSGSYTVLARCECFNVCDAQGNCITECYICHTAPDVRCYGPYPYCPTKRSFFNTESNKDDSNLHIHFGRGRLPGSVCQQDGFVYNNHADRVIQVIYEKITGGTSRQWVAYPRPKDREWLGCATNVGYRIVSSRYQ